MPVARRAAPGSAGAGAGVGVAVALAVAMAVASCQRGSSAESGDVGPSPAMDAATSGDDYAQDGASPGAPEECQAATDCVPAASTCCDCPTFAVPANSGYEEGCAEVMCPPNPDCAPVEATCVVGQCELRCVPVITALECDLGFERSPAGCLLDRCATVESDGPECMIDDDCEQVKADCCGCARGGADTALPGGEVADHLASLECPADPSCPEVDVCDSAAQPRCVVGMCQLIAEPDDGEDEPASPQLCGVKDAPACPQDQVCVLNHPDAQQASDLAVGSCHTPTL